MILLLCMVHSFSTYFFNNQSYYESAITQGRILVSNQPVDCNYIIKGSDVLAHTVHRHEPGVAVHSNQSPFVNMVYSDDQVLVVDKPSTLPIHPCGGYHHQSLIKLLELTGKQKLYTIHRLDRLTSGLVILGKSSNVAQEWGKAVMNRTCQKVYLARVKGKFPLNLIKQQQQEDSDVEPSTVTNQSTLDMASIGPRGISERRVPHLINNYETSKHPSNGEWRHLLNNNDNNVTNIESTENKKDEAMKRRKQNAYGYWITDGNGRSVLPQPNQDKAEELLLQRVFDSQFDENVWLGQQQETSQTLNNNEDHSVKNEADTTEDESKKTKQKMLWFHLACPTRVAQHKDGICEAGKFDTLDDEVYVKGVKPAQTSFGVVRYDATTDSTIILCQPATGRTHQIRLHLQHLGHSIANDPNYGGELWYGNPTGQRLSQMAKAKLEQVVASKAAVTTTEEKEAPQCAPVSDSNTTTTATATRMIRDEPATEQEVQSTTQHAIRQEKESIHDFIRRTCVWCARAGNDTNGDNRDLLEFLIRSNGIWLHALNYSFALSDGRCVSYQAPSPVWSQLNKK